VSTALPIAIRRRGRVGELVTTFPMPFVARAISPNLVATRLGPGELAPHYFTGTVPTADGCIARVAIAAPKNEDGSPATPEAVADLIAGSREAFREDTPVWEHLARGHVARYDERDAAVRMFRTFVAGFRR
jgi:3-ketosteroid 9alpha-monooxygenase subunit A